MRLLIILIFIAMARIGSGQNTDSLYTEDELKVFVRVTILSHNHGINHDSIARAAALRSGISMERLGDIIRAGIDGKSKQITEAEKSALATFEEANAEMTRLGLGSPFKDQEAYITAQVGGNGQGI